MKFSSSKSHSEIGPRLLWCQWKQWTARGIMAWSNDFKLQVNSKHWCSLTEPRGKMELWLRMVWVWAAQKIIKTPDKVVLNSTSKSNGHNSDINFTINWVFFCKQHFIFRWWLSYFDNRRGINHPRISMASFQIPFTSTTWFSETNFVRMVCLQLIRLQSSICGPWHKGGIPTLSLTPWDCTTHICISKLTTSIGSDNGLSPDRRQAIIWTNTEILLTGPIGTNFSEILLEFLIFSLKKTRLKVSSAKWQPFCLDLNVLIFMAMSTSSVLWLEYSGKTTIKSLICVAPKIKT